MKEIRRMRRIFALCVIFAVAFLPVYTESASSLPLLSDIRFTEAFARYLLKEGDIDGAVLEFERCVFSSDVFDRSISHGLFSALFAAKKYTRIQSLFPELRMKAGIAIDDSSVGYIFARSLEETGSWNELDVFLAGVNQPLAGASFDTVKISALVKQRLYEKAVSLLQTYPDNSSMKKLAENIASFKPKKPAAAAVLSALVPGLGRLYAGQWYDGVVSFVSTGVLAGLAAYSFYNNGPEAFQPWLFTIPAAVFYSANVYGSYLAAQRWNNFSEYEFTSVAEEIRDSYAF